MGSASFWSAAIASVTSTALFYPLEMVETRMQADPTPLQPTSETKSGRGPSDVAGLSRRNSNSGALLNLWNSLKSVVRKEGFGALYYGLVSCLIGSAVNCGLYFMFYDYLQQSLWPEEANQPFYQIMSGMMSNGIACFFSNPFFVVKVRLICNPEEYHWSDPTTKTSSLLVSWFVWNNGLLTTFFALWMMVEGEGFLSLWNGVSASLFGTTEWGLQIMIYNQLKHRLVLDGGVDAHQHYHHQHDWRTNLLFFLIGATAKAVALTLTFPYQVIRTKLQQQQQRSSNDHDDSSNDNSNNKSNNHVSKAPRSFFSVAKSIYRESGWKGFTIGILPNLMRQVPPAGLMFFLIEFIKHTLFSVD